MIMAKSNTAQNSDFKVLTIEKTSVRKDRKKRTTLAIWSFLLVFFCEISLSLTLSSPNLPNHLARALA